MFGEEHFSNQYAAPGTINAITREDLISFHQRYIHPANMMIAVSGDFERAAILEKLERAFSGWPAGEPAEDVPGARTNPSRACTWFTRRRSIRAGCRSGTLAACAARRMSSRSR